jgi:hypothetical protein
MFEMNYIYICTSINNKIMNNRNISPTSGDHSVGIIRLQTKGCGD